tara:strand:+ start:635 stop:751 length:117 start_codon:yes stop_codon:yes gene_type:complete
LTKLKKKAVERRKTIAPGDKKSLGALELRSTFKEKNHP